MPRSVSVSGGGAQRVHLQHRNGATPERRSNGAENILALSDVRIDRLPRDKPIRRSAAYGMPRPRVRPRPQHRPAPSAGQFFHKLPLFRPDHHINHAS